MTETLTQVDQPNVLEANSQPGDTVDVVRTRPARLATAIAMGALGTVTDSVGSASLFESR